MAKVRAWGDLNALTQHSRRRSEQRRPRPRERPNALNRPSGIAAGSPHLSLRANVGQHVWLLHASHVPSRAKRGKCDAVHSRTIGGGANAFCRLLRQAQESTNVIAHPGRVACGQERKHRDLDT